MEDRLIPPELVLMVGVRAPTRDQIEFATEKGIRIISMEELTERGFVEEEKLGKVYISIDVDVLDPAHAPGVGNPEPGGMSTRQLIELIKGLRYEGLVGFDLTEVCPPYDVSGITSFAAAKLIREILGKEAEFRAKRGESQG